MEGLPLNPSVPHCRGVRWVSAGGLKWLPVIRKGGSLSDGCTSDFFRISRRVMEPGGSGTMEGLPLHPSVPHCRDVWRISTGGLKWIPIIRRGASFSDILTGISRTFSEFPEGRWKKPSDLKYKYWIPGTFEQKTCINVYVMYMLYVSMYMLPV